MADSEHGEEIRSWCRGYPPALSVCSRPPHLPGWLVQPAASCPTAARLVPCHLDLSTTTTTETHKIEQGSPYGALYGSAGFMGSRGYLCALKLHIMLHYGSGLAWLTYIILHMCTRA